MYVFLKMTSLSLSIYMEERVKQDKISCSFPCVLKAIHFKDSSQRKQNKKKPSSSHLIGFCLN